MSAGEINNGLSGGQEAMDKIAQHSENVQAKLGSIASHVLELAAMIDTINEGIGHLGESDEAVAACDSARIADEEAQTASGTIGGMLQGATNPKASLITRSLTALAEATLTTRGNTDSTIEAGIDDIGEQLVLAAEPLMRAASYLRDFAADLHATADEASMQAGLAAMTKETLGEYNV